MALQASGTITVDDIYTELGNSNIASAGGVSLRSLEDGSFGTINQNSKSTPNGVSPHSMSEWYSYDHGAGVSLTLFNASSVQSTANIACKQSFYGPYYHDGGGADPVTGDTCYSDAKGTTLLPSGYYKYASANSYFQIGGLNGVITATAGCRSERRLKSNINFIGNSPMGIPIYEFEYKNPLHAPYGPGKYIGTMVDDLQKLGFGYSIFEKDGSLWVDYDKIDVDCKLL